MYRVISRILCAVLLVVTVRTTAAHAQAPATPADHDGVRRAVLDYLEGFYEGDTTKLIRSLRPELSKYGFWRGRDSTAFHGEAMTYKEAIDYARQFRARKQVTPPEAPRDVQLLEVQSHSAAAKVTAWWGTDYVLLGKYDGRWMIAQVMWQSPAKR